MSSIFLARIATAMAAIGMLYYPIDALIRRRIVGQRECAMMVFCFALITLMFPLVRELPSEAWGLFQGVAVFLLCISIVLTLLDR
ncbi:MAG: hypothetical protein ABI877_22745, partial [Gemmatimonadaceae bacterium]